MIVLHAERPAASPPSAPRRMLPARNVEQVAAAGELAHFFGLQMIQTHAAMCHPEIEAGDCIEVDFDRRHIRHDGLYLIAIDHDDGGRWYGARRFQYRPGHAGVELWGKEVSSQDWHPVTSAMQSRITVFGEVREVFKPVSKLRRAAA